MRQRLHTTTAQLFADRLRTCVGLNYSKTDETRLLKMLLQEVSPSPSLAEGVGTHLCEPRAQLRRTGRANCHARGWLTSYSASHDECLWNCARPDMDRMGRQVRYIDYGCCSALPDLPIASNPRGGAQTCRRRGRRGERSRSAVARKLSAYASKMVSRMRGGGLIARSEPTLPSCAAAI